MSWNSYYSGLFLLLWSLLFISSGDRVHFSWDWHRYPAFFWLIIAWHIFFHPISFNLSVSLHFRCAVSVTNGRHRLVIFFFLMQTWDDIFFKKVFICFCQVLEVTSIWDNLNSMLGTQIEVSCSPLRNCVWPWFTLFLRSNPFGLQPKM